MASEPSISWKIAAVSVAGFGHAEAGIPCQDAHATEEPPGGFLVAAVSDGAGSATRSADGSRCLSDTVVAHLSEQLIASFDAKETGLKETLVRQWVEEAVEEAHARLGELSEGGPLADFDATLIGVVAGPQGGVFFHVGDGAALATCLDDLSSDVVSPPANGQYSNETYFATQEDWREHLRTTQFGPEFDVIALMSDGVTPFALAGGAESGSVAFFEPLSRFLAEHDRETNELELVALLERDVIRRITEDDKTLVWALRMSG
jgi:Protein phosphatase 2C